MQPNPTTDHPQGASAVISNNSSVSKPIPIFSLGEPPVRSSAIPEPRGNIESSAIEFSGAGGEYFRIWIVNLLLIMVTFGIYYPWAKVRKLKYFYNNTSIDGHALDFHAEPKKMLRGSAIVAVFFMMYSVAVDFSPVAGLIAILAFMALAPMLFRASMRFRLANTSWRGMRFRFVAQDLKEAYWCIVPALALFLLPGVILAFMGDGESKKSAAMPMEGSAVGLYVLAVAIAIPYFFWRLKRYQHNHYAQKRIPQRSGRDLQSVWHDAVDGGIDRCSVFGDCFSGLANECGQHAFMVSQSGLDDGLAGASLCCLFDHDQHPAPRLFHRQDAKSDLVAHRQSPFPF
jgi:Bacterial protein of unknown function (DUF898)